MSADCPKRLFTRLVTVGLASLVLLAAPWGCGKKYSSGGDSGVTDDASVMDQDADVETDAEVVGLCGDGILDPNEDCDDGNHSDDDECLTTCTWACGDGIVNAIEICDTAIAAGQPGACPAGCDDSDECTTDTLVGSECQAECVHGDITVCNDGDGCCPPGCDGTTDDDCNAQCDNGVIESGETCDPISSCPTDCDDSNDCTTDVMTGAAATCDAVCTNTPITTCASGDGCCPTGCNEVTDSDCNPACGNGVVESGETCDPPSSCPTTCDDSNDCTADQLTGAAATCNVACTNTAITLCTGGDGCCPSGCDSTSDSDCSVICGNGIIEAGETCDPPASCPTTCDDSNDCTTDVLTGAPATCDAACSNTAITGCFNNDGCCPAGCNSTNDNDCSISCGNGVVESGETCDPPSSCPTSCDDSDDCTTDLMTGAPATCNVSCTNTAVTSCSNNDGCCPAGCFETTDNDCTAFCGNGVVESGETCDPPGSCPTTCDDSNDCTADLMTGAPATCDVTCANTPITACANGDGCCPAGCDATSDTDCNPICGNSVVEPGETCDPPSSCPTTCDDSDDCTADLMTGASATCNVVCSNTPITACIGGDGCCPAGCFETTDSDCTPVCGNWVVETGEGCDDGNTTSGDGCDALCQPESTPTAFRISDLDLVDPHVYAALPIFGCTDITNNVPWGLADPINTMLQDAIQGDSEPDGYLDTSFLAIFRPFDQNVPYTGNVDIAMGLCTLPWSNSTCDLDPTFTPLPTTYVNQDSGICLDVLGGTTYGYTPSISVPGPICLSTAPVSLSVTLSGIQIPLEEVRLGATFVGNPATSMTDGLLRGFLAEADADLITLPASLPVVGGDPLSSVLPGGAGNCSSHDDRDNNGGTWGWWFYFNFPADEVVYIGP